MAYLQKQFNVFNEELNISSRKRENLKKSKDNIRETIKNYFKSNHSDYTPKFYIQGSYKLRTMIRTKDNTCDLDDGVYFASNIDNVTANTLQNWVFEAVKDVTTASPNHKNKCIRVNYSGKYNIDLPVLIYDENNENMINPLLAVRDSGFQDDDPKAFIEYFNENKNDQMIRLIKFLKAWANTMNCKMPSGLALTVLTMNHYYQSDFDSFALKSLLEEIKTALTENFYCELPTTPNDNLLSTFSAEHQRIFLSCLDKFIDNAKAALEETNIEKSCEFWKKYLGTYFPIGDNIEEEINKQDLLSIASKSKPYFYDKI